jgi:HEAT repeat protein
VEKLGKYLNPAFILLSAAYVAAVLILNLNTQKIFLWVTVSFAAVNMSLLFIHLLLRKSFTFIILLLNLVQIGIFFLLHLQIYTFLGTENYLSPSSPELPEWAKFVGAHVLNALDLPDIIDVYGIKIPEITQQGPPASAALFAMSLFISLFVVVAIFRAVGASSQKKQDAPSVAKWGSLAGLGVAVMMTGVLGWGASGGASQWGLWMLDNLLSTLDIGDAIQIFDRRLSPIKPDKILASAAVFFRLMVIWGAMVLAHRLYLRLTKKRTSVDDVAAVCISAEHSLEERIAAIRHLEELGTFADSAIPNLVKALADPHSDIRSAAADALGEIDSEWTQSEAARSAVSDLIKALFNKDKSARNAAVEALEKIDPEWARSEAARGVIPNLMSALFDKDKNTQMSSVGALGKMGPAAAKAAPSLIRLLSNEDKDIRSAAAAALGEIGSASEEAIPHLIKAMADDHVLRPAAEALEKIGSAGIPELVKGLSGSEKNVRIGSARALDAIDPEWRNSKPAQEAVPELLKTVTDSFSSGRGAAVEALGAIGPAEAVPHLINVLADTEEQVREGAKTALDKIDPQWPQCEDARNAALKFVEALTDADRGAREAAREALSKIDPQWQKSDPVKKSMPRFVKALSNPLNTIRCAGAESLGAMGPVAAKAVPYLIKAAADNDKDVREAAKSSLKKIDPEWQKSESAVKALPRLVKELGEEDWRIRNAAAAALGEMGPTGIKTIPYLVKMLIDSDKRIRETAIGSLEKIHPKWRESKGTRKAISHFLKALGDSKWIVRVSAVEALGEIGPPAADTAPYLMKALKDSVLDVQNAAKAALDKVDPEKKHRDQESEAVKKYVSSEAEELLGDIDPGSPEAIQHLVKKLADSDRKIRLTAKETLEKMDAKWRQNKSAHKGIPNLMEALSDSRWAVRGAAIEALAEFGPLVGKLVVPRFVKAMNTDSSMDVRSAAKRGLEKVDPGGKLRK